MRPTILHYFGHHRQFGTCAAQPPHKEISVFNQRFRRGSWTCVAPRKTVKYSKLFSPSIQEREIGRNVIIKILLEYLSSTTNVFCTFALTCPVVFWVFKYLSTSVLKYYLNLTNFVFQQSCSTFGNRQTLTVCNKCCLV